VDPSLYTGDLVALPILQEDNSFNTSYTEFYVAPADVSVKGSDGNVSSLTGPNFSMPVLLDSGISDMGLPESVFRDLKSGFGVTSTARGDYLPCNRANTYVAISFQFGGTGCPTIEMPNGAFIAPAGSKTSQQPTFDDGTEGCWFERTRDGAGLPGNGFIIGDTFLRYPYLVFDIENNRVAIAQANTGLVSVGNKITAISSGTDVPGCSSTNTLFIPLKTATTISTMSTMTRSIPAGGNLPVTPTFALGSVTTETGQIASASSSSSAVAAAATLVGENERWAILAAAAVLVAAA
jgi:hypothetical protein